MGTTGVRHCRNAKVPTPWTQRAVIQTRRRLPHWEQQGATYFVTFRLADAVPAEIRKIGGGKNEFWNVKGHTTFTGSTIAIDLRRM